MSATIGTTRRPVASVISAAVAVELLSTARGNHDIDAFLGQLPRDRLADAAAATCHDGALAAQLQIHEPLFPLLPTMIG